MSLIPKVIYQTWKTKKLDLKLQNVINNIQNLNPNYKIILFDDNDIEIWIKQTFADNIIYNTYKQLNVGAAKADFWRYLILYMNGGIYLDIDSNINKSLDLLINDNDHAIISREKNSNTFDFVQWCLMFSPKHPILLKTINLCIYNINNKVSTWLPNLTGPHVFTIAINKILKNHYSIKFKKNLFYFDDKILNNIFNNKNNTNKKIFCRFYGKDYNNFCEYNNGCKDILLQDSLYWKECTKIFNEYIDPAPPVTVILD